MFTCNGQLLIHSASTLLSKLSNLTSFTITQMNNKKECFIFVHHNWLHSSTIFKLKSLITSEGLINYYYCCCRDSTTDIINARYTNSRATRQIQFKVKSGVTAIELSQVGLASVRRCPTMSNNTKYYYSTLHSSGY